MPPLVGGALAANASLHNTSFAAKALSRKASSAFLGKRTRKTKRYASQHNWIHKQNNIQLGVAGRYATEHLNTQINPLIWPITDHKEPYA